MGIPGSQISPAVPGVARLMDRSFPLAFLLNTFSLTVLLIVAGLSGSSSLAAEIGIIQGATLALFYAFSANARSLILGQSPISASSVMIKRLVLLLPLAGAAFWLSARAGDIDHWLIIVLILRRCVEWMGEVHLSEMERVGDKAFARRYFFLQAIPLLLAVYAIAIGHTYLLPILFLWAVLPLLPSLGFIVRSFVSVGSISIQFAMRMLPHLGSTAIIGITVYVFRILILLVAGKEVAGDLYAAFAIGGLAGSVFANVLGASVALHEQRTGKPYFPSPIKIILFLLILLGAALFLMARLDFGMLALANKSPFFIQAVGLSLMGGSIMVYAQRIRFRVLQSRGENDIFGPDVIVNMLIVAAVPILFELYSVDALSGLYLLSSLMSLCFYTSASREKKKSTNQSASAMAKSPAYRHLYLLAFAVLILLPLFVQFKGVIFDNSSPLLHSNMGFAYLPIPLSILACYIGILILGNYSRSTLSFGFIFASLLLMSISAITTVHSNPQFQQGKLLLMIQLVIPMAGLAFGQMYMCYENRDPVYCCSKAFLYVLGSIVPFQLVATWMQQSAVLTSYLYLFSIHNHLDYVPVVFVGAYLISLFGLWAHPRYRNVLVLLALLMTIYSVLSSSPVALAMLLVGVMLFLLLQMKRDGINIRLCILLAGVLTITGMHYVQNGTSKHVVDVPQLLNDARNLPQSSSDAQTQEPKWKVNVSNVFQHPGVFFFGHPHPTDKADAYFFGNYYADLINNFGIVGFLPVFLILIYTFSSVFIKRKALSAHPSMVGLVFVVSFLLIVENNFNDSLLHPYPSIFTFFLLGILLNALSTKS